jgi:DNA-binding response OmpR family regulator
MENAQPREHILMVGDNDELVRRVIETLSEAGGYTVTHCTTFEDALGEILRVKFDLIITQAELPDLSGMDLLAVVTGLRPNAKVIVIDDELSPRGAIAVYRLGAVDYLYRPLNMSFLLMQVERQLESSRHAQRPQLIRTDQQASNDALPGQRNQQPDPKVHSVALVLGREQFQQVNHELTRLLNHVKATFVGLVDSDGNLVGAAGTLAGYNLDLLSQALNIGQLKQQSLTNTFEVNKFHSTYFEGDKNGIYIIEFGGPYVVSLAVICDADVKPGMVWLYSKRTANTIDDMLQNIPTPHRRPSLG